MQAVHVLNTVTVPMGLQLGTDSGKHSGEGSGARGSSCPLCPHRLRVQLETSRTTPSGV